MSILLISNAGFLREKNSTFITRMTGQFVSEVEKNINQQIRFFQFVEEGEISSGINDYEIARNNIETVFFFKGKKKIISYIHVFFKIFFFLKKARITYIFFPGNVSLLMAWKCFLFNQPYALYVRGEYKHRLARPLFRKAKFVNTVGLVFKNDIQKINSNCHLIKPMVLFDFSKPCTEPSQARKKEILFVGRIEEHKGIWEILEAAKKLKGSLPEYKIRLIGSGKDMEKVREHIETHNLNNVILNGPVYNPDLLRLFYLSSTMFLLPTYNEGFPRVIYESMYFNLPVITTFVGNIPGIMEDGVNCLKINAKSSSSIVEKVEYLSKDQALREKLSNNGQETLNQIFSSDIKTHSELFISQFSQL